MKRKSEIKLELPPFTELKELFKSQFPDCKVKNKAFADIWEIRKGPLRHSLYYNFDRKKNSMLRSEFKSAKEAKILTGAVFLIVLVFLILDLTEILIFELNFLIWPAILISSVSNHIIPFFKPEHKNELKEEHVKLLKFFESYKI